MKTKTKAVIRSQRFHGEYMTNSGPQNLHGKTLEECKRELEKVVGGTTVYRPDPQNSKVTFCFNTQYATQLWSEDKAQVPIGWIATIDVPSFLAEEDAASIELGVAPTTPNGMDELLVQLQEVGDGE